MMPHRPRTEGSWIHCSANREDEVIERDALMFPQAIAEHPQQKPAGHKPWERTGALCVNSANPHAIGDLARGVKDLLARSRCSKSRRREAKRPALAQSNAH
jgi:hypothetical protein